jgi:paraquat-inducible protein B
MSRKANPTVVGVFVMGAIALVLAGMMFFGTGRLFDERVTIVSFFEGTVTGLQVGSPVEFRGVPVGTVTAIKALYDPEKSSLMIPVYMTLVRGSVTNVGADTEERSPEEVLAEMVENGLRARLDIRSLVTGQVFVALDFHPETPATLVGVDAETLEVPSTESRRDKIIGALDKLNIDELAATTVLAIDGINDVVRSPDLLDTLDNLSSMTKHGSALVEKLDGRIDGLSDSALATLQQTERSIAAAEVALVGTLGDMSTTANSLDERITSSSSRLEATLEQIQSLAGNLDRQIEPLSASARGAFDQATATMSAAEELVSSDSRTRYNLDVTLEELAAASRAVRLMAEYLQQNPDALLKGKSP